MHLIDEHRRGTAASNKLRAKIDAGEPPVVDGQVWDALQTEGAQLEIPSGGALASNRASRRRLGSLRPSKFDEVVAARERRVDAWPARSEPQAEHVDMLSDEDLIRRCREHPAQTARCLDLLFERVYPRVAHWCRRSCRNRDEAADLAQDVILRAYTKLDSFRLDSQFSTWLYAVSRRVAIDRGIQRRREASRTAPEEAAESLADSGATSDATELLQLGAAVREAMITDLDPLEARVVYLHHVDGFSLPAVTELLGLSNKSGAKTYLVSGMRKLRRRFQQDAERESNARDRGLPASGATGVP